MSLNSWIYSIPYIIIFSLLFMLSFRITNNNKLNSSCKIVQWQIIFFTLFIFLGLRGFIQSDWITYYGCFLDAPTLYDDKDSIAYFFTKGMYSDLEKGFLFSYIFCKSIIPEWWFFQSVHFIINFIIVIIFIKRFTPKHLLLGICFYFAFGALRYDINLMRNTKSILIFALSLKYATEKRFFPYLCLNLLGLLFHTTAIIFIPLYFIIIRKPSKKMLLTIFIVGNLVYLFHIKWVQSILEIVAGLIGGRLGKIAIAYLGSERWTTGYGISIGYLERTFTFFLALHYMDRLLLKKNNIVLLNVLFVYLFSYLFLSEMSILTDRIPILFMFSYWVFYPQIYSFLNKERKMLFLVVFFMYSVLKILSGYGLLTCSYDNLLFPKYTIEERNSNLRRLYKSLGV